MKKLESLIGFHKDATKSFTIRDGYENMLLAQSSEERVVGRNTGTLVRDSDSLVASTACGT